MGFITPTVPADIGNQVVMRAWYQALRKSLDGILVSVKDFGAVGNGSVDDTTAFTKALAYASQNYNCIYVPAGNYKLTSGFELTAAISIFGDGPSLSVLEPHFDTSDTYLFKMTAGGSLNVFDIGFDGNDVSNPTPTDMVYMIQVTPTSGTLENVDIHNVKFSNLNMFNGVYGIAADGDLRVTHCMSFTSTNHISIRDCVADTVSGCFAYFTDCNSVVIKDNTLEDVKWYPIHLEEGNDNFFIVCNKLNLDTTTGVLFGGAIDILENVSDLLLANGNALPTEHHGIIVADNIISGYFAWDGVIHIASALSVKVERNIIKRAHVGTYGASGVISHFAYVRVRTRGASDTTEYGPCLNISICDNFFEGVNTATGETMYGVYVTNDSQSASVALERRQIERLTICGNHIGYHLWNTSTYQRSTSAFERAIVIDGMSGGVETVIVENNICYVKLGTSPTPKGSGAISFFGSSADGGCDKIQIGGNSIINYGATTKYGIDIGAYTTKVTNTKPNYIESCAYAVATSATGCSNLFYLDDQVASGSTTADYLFNTQLTKSYHRNDGGTTANRPGSTSNRTTYTTYFDTSLDGPLWFDGTNWVDAYGTTAGSYTNGQLLIGNTATGTIDPATLTAGTNITITNGANSITIAAAAGVVNTTGTPANNQIAVFTDADTIEGTSTLTYDGVTFTVGTADIMTLNGSVVTSDIGVNNDTRAIVEVDTHVATAGSGSVIYLARSRGTTASPTVVSSGDSIGTIGAVAYDGTDYALGARIDFEVGTTPGSNDMPTNILFKVSPDGSQTPATAMTINYTKQIDLTGDLNLAASTNLKVNSTNILADSAGTMTLSNIDALDTTTNETICDAVGAMVTGNTESRITVTYQDSDNTLDFELDTTIVDTTGTPANNQIAVFTDANTIEGTSTLTFDGTNLAVGGGTVLDLGGTLLTPTIQAQSDSQTQFIYSTHSSATAATCTNQYFIRSNNTAASPTIVASGDRLGSIFFVGFDGTDYALGAGIHAEVGTTPGSNDMPSNLVLRTTADAASSPTTRMTIYYDGGVVVGSPTGGNKGTGTINAVAVYDDNVLLTCYVFDQFLEGAIDLNKWDAKVPNRVVKPELEDKDKSDKVEVRYHDSARKFKSRINSEYDPLDIDKYTQHFKDKKHLTSMPNEVNFDPLKNLSAGEWIQRLIETVEIQAIHISQLNDRLKVLEGDK